MAPPSPAESCQQGRPDSEGDQRSVRLLIKELQLKARSLLRQDASAKGKTVFQVNRHVGKDERGSNGYWDNHLGTRKVPHPEPAGAYTEAPVVTYHGRIYNLSLDCNFVCSLGVVITWHRAEPCINRVWPMTFRLLFDGRHFLSISLEKYMAGVRGVAQNVAKQAIGYLLFQLTNADSYGRI